MKRGVSPVIGAVIMIGLIFVIASGYFVWTKNYSSKIWGGASGTFSCDKVNFVLGDFCYKTVGDGKEIHFTARNDASDFKLQGFLISLNYKGGTISVSVLDEIDSQSSKKLVAKFTENVEGIEQVRVAPKIKLINEFVICEEKEVIVKWAKIKEC